MKNLGIKGVEIYEKEVKYFERHDFNFCTIKDYCIEKKLI
jgi:hypothetical protein